MTNMSRTTRKAEKLKLVIQRRPKKSRRRLNCPLFSNFLRFTYFLMTPSHDLAYCQSAMANGSGKVMLVPKFPVAQFKAADLWVGSDDYTLQL
jgi:hypothetical protein